MHTNIWYDSLQERGYCEDLDSDERILLKLISEEENGQVWTGFIWLRTETSGGLL
jgi:hypothetical protein